MRHATWRNTTLSEDPLGNTTHVTMLKLLPLEFPKWFCTSAKRYSLLTIYYCTEQRISSFSTSKIALHPVYVNVTLSAGRKKHSIKNANNSFEDVEKFRYLRTALTDLNCMHEEMMTRLNSGTACYHSVQSLFYSRLPSRNVKVETQNTNSVICFVLVWNLFYHIKGGAYTEGVWEQGPEENIWT